MDAVHPTFCNVCGALDTYGGHQCKGITPEQVRRIVREEIAAALNPPQKFCYVCMQPIGPFTMVELTLKGGKHPGCKEAPDGTR